MKIVVTSKFIKHIPKNTVVQFEMLFNDMAEKTPDGLKFVNIPYDPAKLGSVMTLVPFVVKDFQTGKVRPDSDAIIEHLMKSSSSKIKILSNRLSHRGINVGKIIQPALGMDPANKAVNRSVLDKVRQQLSNAIIDSPALQGKDMLGNNIEGVVVNMPSGPFKVTSSKMKAAMAAKMQTASYGDTRERTAVIAVGNFAGHRGHEQLINFAIDRAKQLGGTPFVFVGQKVGVDDPIDVDTKLATLRKLFPGVEISAVENQTNPETGEVTPGSWVKKIEYGLVKKAPFYNNIVIAVGSDQAEMSRLVGSMQKRYSSFPPLSHVKVSIYVTPRTAGEGGTGVSTTQLRNALRELPHDEAFAVWSQAYNVKKLGKPWIEHLMQIARQNMGLKK